MERKEITFKDWLDKKQIKYTIEDEDCVILNNENDLRNYERELLRLFPEIEFA